MTRQAGYQDVPGFENDFDNPASVLARHRVSIGVDIDQAIQRHLPHARQGLRCDELEGLALRARQRLGGEGGEGCFLRGQLADALEQVVIARALSLDCAAELLDDHS